MRVYTLNYEAGLPEVDARPYSFRQIGLFLFMWAALVTALAMTHIFAKLPLPIFGLFVGAVVTAFIVTYILSPRLQATASHIGLRWITALHIWRIPAALAFFYYGSKGLLPEQFVINAGWGDALAGVLALLVATILYRSRSAYWVFHIVGFLDFCLAVGTGLTFSILAVQGMETIAIFPMALIPLFGVTLSALTHVMAFHLLLQAEPSALGRKKVIG